MNERQHHLNESSSARLRRSQKLEILPSPNSKSLDALHLRAHTSFIGREDFNGRLVTVVYYETRTFLMRRIYFMYAQIFWIGAEILTSALFLSYIMWCSNFTIPHSFAAYICRLYFAAYVCRIHLPPTFAADIFRQHLPHTFAAYIFRQHFPPTFAAYICRIHFPPTF